MKTFIQGFRGKALLCGLCLYLGSALLIYRGSFLFLGEPEIPESLQE